MAIKARREIYKGRKLVVKRSPQKWGYVESYINGQILGVIAGVSQDAADRELASLRAWVDAADERRLTEPDAYPAHFYVGA